MSDSESDFGDVDDRTTWRRNMDNKECGVITLHPTEVVYEGWSGIPVRVKKEATQLMKLCSFWYPILLQRQDSNCTTRWAMQVGFVELTEGGDLTLKAICKIEILEAILNALESGCSTTDNSKHVIWISNKFNLHSAEVLEDALRWLEQTGEPLICQRIGELGHKQTRYIILQHIFTEYAQYIQAMGVNVVGTLKALKAQPDEAAIEKSEELKRKGNESFQEKKYAIAVKYYSQAIRYYPENHIIYGNRALCYIRSEKYLKAVADGKRAILIKPMWAKGHYRYCEAMFSLGEYKRAIESNTIARIMFRDDREGSKDLEQQLYKFHYEMEDLKDGLPREVLSKIYERVDGANKGDGAEESQPQTGKPAAKLESTSSKTPQSKVSEVKMDKRTQPGKKEGAAHSQDSKPTRSELSDKKNGKGECNGTAKKKSKTKNDQPKEEVTQTVVDHKATGVCEVLRSAVQDAHTALADLRSRNAEHAFSRALALLETNTRKELGLTTLDVVLLFYGRASALIESGQPEELAEAQRVFAKIKSFEERTFQCLVFYGIGRVYLKENRYPVALGQFTDSLQMVKNQITPGILTWPMTKEIVKETQLDYFKELLVNAIELCKFPPAPDAKCRHERCRGSLKIEIYFTDPDFKGFIRIGCCQRCIVEYHINCWKTLKMTTFSEKNEKDFLQEACFTPGCSGRICSIHIFGSTGLIKCKFEVDIPKPKGPQKMKVNQRSTSVTKLKAIEERKLRKKQCRRLAADQQGASSDMLLEKENSTAQPQQKAWLLYRDRVLLQISLNMELLREENNLHVPALLSSLEPWLKLDLSRGNQLAGRILSWQQQPPETLGHAAELLLERRNRVWARVLVQVLSSCSDINPKVHDWACQLNDAGLTAARGFLDRYAAELEELDLAPLLGFGPLQDMLIEKFGARPEFFIDLTVTEYLKQAPAQDMRLFIWTLEEHRDQYVPCHTILDEYFEMMDGHCLVLKKSENDKENTSPIKTKTRSRKKKHKEPKGIIVWSGMRGATPRDDQDFFDEDDSLSFLHPGDPFSVPNHLREQVANFEDQYNGADHSSHYKKILDNNPDPTKESLYDYFAQILEEHGPLAAQDPLLVGELDNFPPVAQQKIQEAGGFEPFLLESLRFIKMGACVGLARHAVSLQQAGHGNSLDDLDVIADADINSSDPHLHSYLQEYYSAQSAVYPSLSSPYVVDPQLGLSTSRVDGSWQGDEPLSYRTLQSDGRADVQYNHFSAGEFGEVDLYGSEVEEGVVGESVISSGMKVSMTTEKSPLKKPSALQARLRANRSVAVNTEVFELFEGINGDISKKEKDNKELEQQLNKIVNDRDGVNLRRKEAITSLEKDIQDISANIQVTNKELALFQQKLEEEVKKDQKEKKANQELLKALKMETEKLVEEHEGLTKSIRGKNNKYEARLNEFLELSNQSAAEKMSLEDEIKRCKDLSTKATRRSQAAQLSVVESCRDQSLYCLYRPLMDARAILAKLEEVGPRYPAEVMAIPRNNWRARIQEAEEKIANTEIQYKDQMEQVKNGSRLSTLPPVNVAKPPELPILQMPLPAQQFAHHPSPQASYCGPRLPQQPGPPGAGLPAQRQPGPPGAGLPAQRQPGPPGAGLPAQRQPGPPGAGLPAQRQPGPPGAGLPAQRQPGPPGAGLPAQRQPGPPGAGLPAQRQPGPPGAGLPAQRQPGPPGAGLPAQRQPGPPGAGLPAQRQPGPPGAGLPAQRQPGPPGAGLPAQRQPGPPGAGLPAQRQPGPPGAGLPAQRQPGPPGAGLPAQRQPGPPGAGLPAQRQPQQPQPNTMFNMALQRLAAIFPDYTRSDLMRFVQDVRVPGGGLNSMPLQDVVNAVTQRILDQQEQITSGAKSSIQQVGSPARCASPASPAWQAVGQKPSQTNALNMEDPCIICHDDMSPDDVCVLECRHSFHTECIKSWLKEQSTCPTCRDHALLPDDFPMLPGRRRRGHNPAAF